MTTDVALLKITSPTGASATLTDAGASLVSLEVPDRRGDLANITLSLPRPQDYLVNPSYFGCTVGRYANRLANGAFELDGKVHSVTVNESVHSLHGGEKGFSRRFWVVSSADERGVVFHLRSPDGEEGYPGNLEVDTAFRFEDDGALTINYLARTDSATFVNLTNHAYFNLAGASSTIHDHWIRIHAQRYTPVGGDLIPTGDIIPVEGTPFDFRLATKVGDILAALPDGVDHNFEVGGASGQVRIAAELGHPASGRRMEVWTDQPGIQFYTGNFLGGPGTSHPRHAAVCLETQAFPDSPNQANFPGGPLLPGEEYRHVTRLVFGADA